MIEADNEVLCFSSGELSRLLLLWAVCKKGKIETRIQRAHQPTSSLDGCGDCFLLPLKNLDVNSRKTSLIVSEFVSHIYRFKCFKLK